jgi:hypothetical protein
LSVEPAAAAAGQSPHFDTPDAAMRYLVAAYNAHDMTAERHVTTPDARTQLESERQWVNTFSFDNCQVDGTQGDYVCTFDMVSMVPTPSASASPDTTTGDTAPDGSAPDNAASDDTVIDSTDSTGAATEMGEITVLAAPALRPGWYMYASEGCGG